jgi:CDP-paratose 2-epimerase
MSCIYGPRQFGIEDQGWVAWFIIATELGRPITIYGDGKQVRDILFVEDLVEAYLRAWKNRAVTAGKIFNIGGGPDNQMSLLELVAELEALFGRKIPLSFGDWRAGDQPIYVSSIDRVKQVLGWTPAVGKKEGVRRLFEWVRANRSLFDI